MAAIQHASPFSIPEKQPETDQPIIFTSTDLEHEELIEDTINQTELSLSLSLFAVGQ